ncbi:MAG: tetratricopeptide repeat protein [Opitutales bacterium]
MRSRRTTQSRSPGRTRFTSLRLFIFLGSFFLATASGQEKSQASDFSSTRLLKIAEKEQAIYEKAAEDPDYRNNRDLERRINEVARDYRSYLADNPEDVDALILYGKLLRRLGEKKQAFNIFLKADALDPRLAVVKQQIGAYLAEQGKGKAALTFYLNAVELEPETPAYAFGLGQLIFKFRERFIEENIYSRESLDREMMKAFRSAAELAPDNFNFQMRLGEAYYDLKEPDWTEALQHWENLREQQADTPLRKSIIDLHRARVLIELERFAEAGELARSVDQPALQATRREILDQLP